MSIVSLQNLSMFYGAEELFSGVSADIHHGARIALVGPNGAGKTTLVNLILGDDTPTAGRIFRAKDLRLGHLPQQVKVQGEHTLYEEAMRAFAHIQQLERDMANLAEQMADGATDDAVMAAYSKLQETYEAAGGYEYTARLRIVLAGLGFTEADYDTPLPQLSGGQRTRALLARLLLEAPDLLILDEPTNHLDIEAVEWLENYLKSFSGAVLAVSHDRYFIDNFASTVWELEFGMLEVYRGNYSHYARQREERRERLLKEYEQQQAFLAKEEAYIRKNMGGRLTAQAKGRLKRLQTMAKRGKIINRPPRNRRKMHLRLKANARSGDEVLKTRGLVVGYDEPLLQVPDFTLYRGETAALIGPNGVGKSTFLKTIVGQLAPLAGEVQLGAQVKIGYFAQAHEDLHAANTVLDELLTVRNLPIDEARNYLGRFLFSNDDVFRKVETLSGGERGRLALAKLALDGANVLLLDEPTNHLDIDSQEILQSVLEGYDGTIILVTHDRYLVNALATQIWAAMTGQLRVFTGGYVDYLEARERERQAKLSQQREQDAGRKAAQYAEKKHGLNPYQLQQRLEALENEIEALEAQMDALTAAIDEAGAAGDTEQVRELGERYTEMEAALQAAMEEWERLAE